LNNLFKSKIKDLKSFRINIFFRTKSAILFIMAASTFVLVSCQKSSQNAPIAPTVPPISLTPLDISSINPASGPYSTIVTITGTGFDTSTAKNSIKFNGVRAVVQKATSTQLMVVVPKAAGTGAITAQVGSQSALGPVFTYSYTVTVSTLAGSGIEGFADGDAASAQFDHPMGVAVDLLGNIYVADEFNNCIRKINSVGMVSTLAGSVTAGYLDGKGAAAKFSLPTSLTIDVLGNIYISELFNHIRKVTPDGTVSTLAGIGPSGYVNGNVTVAQFNNPAGVALDINGNIYVADTHNERIRKISPSGIVSTLAGNGTLGFADGNGSSAQFNDPFGLAADAQGNIYVADQYNSRIRKITPSGIVSTQAGSGIAGSVDGNSAVAQFDYPAGVAIDAQGNIYVADQYSGTIREISPAGLVSTLAGTGTIGFTNGNGSVAQFSNPFGVTIDSHGNIYVADYGNECIRLITVQ
jgi:sugar lactone lactonase YvrE